MGKIYCTECGEELDDSVNFCSKCGNVIDDNVPNKDNMDNVIENLNFTPFIIGICIVLVSEFINFLVGNRLPTFLGMILASFIVAYLSKESFKIVLVYVFILASVTFFISYMAVHDFYVYSELFALWLVGFLFSLIGRYVKLKIKS